MAQSTGTRPSVGSGTYETMSRSEHTTSFRSDSTSGMAWRAGTGVTSPTQSEESRGVSSGTGRSKRGRSPATPQYLRIKRASVERRLARC
jgi:hypothetical protein